MTGAIILTGSHVWDQDSFESLTPRALLPVANAPLITHLLGWLRDGGLHVVCVCTNENVALLHSYLGDGTDHGLDLMYYEDRIPRGPAGCLRDAAELCGAAEQFVVVDGAVVPDFRLRDLLEHHRHSGGVGTVVVHDVDDPQGGSAGQWRPAGLYVFSSQALARVPATGYQDIKETLLPQLHRSDALVTVFPAPPGSPRAKDLYSYLGMQGWMLARLQRAARLPAGYERHGDAFVHSSAHVAGTARLIGPVMVGPETLVDEEAIITGPTAIGGRCVVGRGAVVGRSVLWDHATVGAKGIIDRCVVAHGVSIDAGTSQHAAVCLDGLGRLRRWSTRAG